LGPSPFSPPCFSFFSLFFVFLLAAKKKNPSNQGMGHHPPSPSWLLLLPLLSLLATAAPLTAVADVGSAQPTEVGTSAVVDMGAGLGGRRFDGIGGLRSVR
jgi:hypothetical protein